VAKLTPRPKKNPLLRNKSPIAEGEYLEIHAIADRIELRAARAYELSVKRLEEKISEDALILALELGDVNRAMKLFSLEVLQDVLEPLGNIISDAVIRGGKEGEADLKENLEVA